MHISSSIKHCQRPKIGNQTTSNNASKNGCISAPTGVKMLVVTTKSDGENS